MLIKLPDGVIVNLDDVRKIEVSGSDLVLTHPDTSAITYAAGSAGAAQSLLEQIFDAPINARSVTLVAAAVARSITSVTPSSVVGSASSSVTIAGTNMIDQAMIDRGELLVKINGSIAGVVSSTPSSIDVVVPVLAAGAATIEIYQNPYYSGSPVLLCSDAVLLTLT